MLLLLLITILNVAASRVLTLTTCSTGYYLYSSYCRACVSYCKTCVDNIGCT